MALLSAGLLRNNFKFRRSTAPLRQDQQQALEVQGKIKFIMYPRPSRFDDDDIVDALQESRSKALVSAARRVLEKTPA